MPFLFPEGVTGLYRLDVTYGIGGTPNPFHSIHYYQASGSDGVANDIGSWFVDNYPDVFAPIVSNLCDALSVVATNLGSTTDVYTGVASFTGEVGGELLAPWDCWVFRESTRNRLAPYGYKRIGYLTESVVQNGGAAIAGISDELDAYADFLDLVVATSTATYTPVLVSPANESHDDNLVLSILDSTYQKHGHAIGRKSY